MKKPVLLLLVILLSSAAETAFAGNAWSKFCEKHLIADAPAYADPAYRQKVLELQLSTSEPQTFAKLLIKEYRATGAKIYWLGRKNGSYKHHLQNYLQTVGDELRTMMANAIAMVLA